MKIGDKYLVPEGTKLWFINLQQSLITTRDYVIEITHTMHPNKSSFFGDLFEITFQHTELNGLLKVLHGETTCDLSMVEPWEK